MPRKNDFHFLGCQCKCLKARDALEATLQDKLKVLKVIAIPRSFLVPDRLSPMTGASLTVSYTEFRGTGPPTVTRLLGNPGDIYIDLHEESPKLYCKVSLTAWVEWSGPLSGLGAGIRHPTFSDYTLQCGVGSATEIEWVPNSVAEQKCTLVEGSSRKNVARVLHTRSARIVVTTVPKKRRQKITPASSKRRKLVDASCKRRGIPVNATPVSEPSSQPNVFSEFPLSTTFASALNSGHSWNPDILSWPTKLSNPSSSTEVCPRIQVMSQNVGSIALRSKTSQDSRPPPEGGVVINFDEPPPPRRLTAINLPTSLDEQLSTDPPPVDPTEKHAGTRPEEKMQVDTPIGPLGQDGFNADEQATEAPSSGERVEPPLQDVTNTLELCSALLSSSVGCPSLQDSAPSGPQRTESGQDVVLEDRTSTLSHPPAIILNQQTVTEYPSAAPKDESILATAPLDDSHPASHTVNPVLEQAAAHEFAKVESVENRPHIEGIDSTTQAAKISTFEGPYEMISQDAGHNTVRSDPTPALATAVNVSPVADVPTSTESGKDVLVEASSTPITDVPELEAAKPCTPATIDSKTTNSCSNVAFMKDEAVVQHLIPLAPPANRMHVEIMFVKMDLNLACRLCLVTDGACTTKFPGGTSLGDLVTHCEQAHSDLWNDLLGLGSGQLARIKGQMDECML